MAELGAIDSAMRAAASLVWFLSAEMPSGFFWGKRLLAVGDGSTEAHRSTDYMIFLLLFSYFQQFFLLYRK